MPTPEVRMKVTVTLPILVDAGKKKCSNSCPGSDVDVISTAVCTYFLNRLGKPTPLKEDENAIYRCKKCLITATITNTKEKK